MKEKENYENLEEMAISVAKVLIKQNTPLEDIMYLTGKTKEEIEQIKKELEK